MQRLKVRNKGTFNNRAFQCDNVYRKKVIPTVTRGLYLMSIFFKVSQRSHERINLPQTGKILSNDRKPNYLRQHRNNFPLTGTPAKMGSKQQRDF